MSQHNKLITTTSLYQINMEKPMFLVALDTRGLPAGDLQEGFDELACSHEFFINHIVRNPNTKIATCPLAEICGLTKHLWVYFQEYTPGGHGSLLGDDKAITDQDVRDARSEYFPLGQQNNPAATLLTLDPTDGYARFNVQGVAYVLYDDGNYPISKEQVWGLCELAKEAKDVYFCDRFFHEGKAKYELAKWCRQYKSRSWGPSSIYEPRKIGKVDQRYSRRRRRHRRSSALFSETCLL
jgi:hypothetical protein